MPPVSVLPVGVAEISERLGVRQQTVAQWKLRGLLPAPLWQVSRQPAWNWPDIEAWARSRPSLSEPATYSFRLYLSVDGIRREDAEVALAAAGAELPIAWRERRTLVSFRRTAANYSEAVAFTVNQLPVGIAAEGAPAPLGTA